MMLAAAGAGGDNYWYVKTSANNTGNANIVPGGLDVDSSGVAYCVSTVVNDSRDVMILKKVQDAPPTINDRVTCHNHNPYGSDYGDPSNYNNCQLYDNETKLHIDGFGYNPYGLIDYKFYRYNTNLTQNVLYSGHCGHSVVSNAQSGSGMSNRLYPVGTSSHPYYHKNGHVRENGDLWVQGYDGYYSYLGAFIKGSTKLSNYISNHQAGCHQVGAGHFRQDAAGHCIAVDNDDDHVYWSGVLTNSGPHNYYSPYPFIMAARWDSTNEIMTHNSSFGYNGVSVPTSGFSGNNKYSGNTLTISPNADSSGDKWVYAAWLENYSYYRGIYYLKLKITSSGKTLQYGFNEISGMGSSTNKRVWDSAVDSQENYYLAFNDNDGYLTLWKYNSSGTYQWNRTFSYSGASGSNAYTFCDNASGGLSSAYFRTSLKIDSNDNIYIHTGTMTPSSGTQPFLIKYPSDGSLTGNFGDLSITSNGYTPSSAIGWTNITSSSFGWYTPSFGSSSFKNNTAANSFLSEAYGHTANNYNTNGRATSNSSQIIV